MKKWFAKAAAALLSLAMLACMVPVGAIAADDEYVLTSITYPGATATDGLTSASDRAVTLTIPFSFPGTLNLERGLVVQKAPGIDSYVVTGFSGPSASANGGDTVTMQVAYYKNGDTSTQHTTTYTISVVRAAPVAPTFSGTISKAASVVPSAGQDDIITFSASEFLSKYVPNDGGEMTNVAIVGSGLAYGSLKIKSGSTYANYAYNPSNPADPANLIPVSKLGSLVFDVAPGAPDGTVSYEVYAFGTDTGTPIAKVILNITVRPISAPTVKAAMTKAVVKGVAYTFSQSDFTGLCDLNYGTLKSVRIIPQSTGTGAGAWYNGSAAFTSSTVINDVSKLKFNGTSAGTVEFRWTVSNEAGESQEGTGTITVEDAARPTITGPIAKSIQNEVTYVFTLSDFTSRLNLNNGTLSAVAVTPAATTCGTWYKDSTPISAGTQVVLSPSSVGSLKFKATAAGTASFTWTAANEKGASDAGSGTITVSSATSKISYTAVANAAKVFSASDFNSACINATTTALSYVTFNIPSTSVGRLYTGYQSSSSPGAQITSSSTQCAASSLSTVAFVPASGTTGTVTLTYKGVSVTGSTFTGSIVITYTGSTLISYTTTMNSPKTFSATDFASACYSATGSSLSYVVFTSVTTGTLYYGYTSSASPGTAVAAGTAYSASYLGSITYVPPAGYTGTATVYYTGYATSGLTYTGTVTITVGGSTAISYTTTTNSPKTFSATDFASACYSATGSSLSYVVFTSVTTGTLYYGYVSSASPGTAVAAGTAYSASYLGSITYVPPAGYTGTATVYYTGYATSGLTYTGTVTVTVGGSTAISYTTTMNSPKTFSATDFASACYSATGSSLSYVVFTSVTTGTLYYGYVSSASPGTAVAAGTAYSASYLGSITYVPPAGYTGTATVYYTGYATSGLTYTGTVTIAVGGSVPDINISTFEDTPVSFTSSDFAAACKGATGASLSYVKFTPPLSAYGALKYDYLSAASPGTAVSANTAYYAASSPYISRVTFVPAANYKGTVTITYTGYDANGASFSGKVVIAVADRTGSSCFKDVGSSYDWAADAVDYLYAKGIVSGTGTGTFGPAQKISRGDFILMLYRALGFKGTPASMFSDVPVGSYYYEAIAAAKALGIAEGSNNKFSPTSSLTRQDAMVLIYRALKATGKGLADGAASDIAGFSDKSKISSYALIAVETLVKAKIITGSNSQINPLGQLSRAEMAVILHRVLTM